MPENKMGKYQDNTNKSHMSDIQNDVNQKSSVFEENLDKFKELASFVIWYP